MNYVSMCFWTNDRNKFKIELFTPLLYIDKNMLTQGNIFLHATLQHGIPCSQIYLVSNIEF